MHRRRCSFPRTASDVRKVGTGVAVLSPKRRTKRGDKENECMIGCCWDALSGIGSIFQAVATIGLFVLALKKGNQVYLQWQNGKAVKRSEFLAQLVEKFESDNIQDMVMLAGDSTNAQKWLEDVLNDRQMEMKAQSSFRFFSYLCYLIDMNLISEHESGLFEDSLKSILSNQQVQEYISITKNDSRVAISYKNLLNYAKRNNIDIYAANGDGGNYGHGVQSTVNNPTETSIVEENGMRPPLTLEELSLHPVAVIRINRLYRQDMTPGELYDATRGWWRVNLDVANKADYALSIAEGQVKEVYKINKNSWHKYGTATGPGDPSAGGRYQFDGEVVKDASIRRLYVGRSVEGLFKQGDAYPVRYFGIKA